MQSGAIRCNHLHEPLKQRDAEAMLATEGGSDDGAELLVVAAQHRRAAAARKRER